MPLFFLSSIFTMMMFKTVTLEIKVNGTPFFGHFHKGKHFCDFMVATKMGSTLNPIALRKAKIVFKIVSEIECNVNLSECNRLRSGIYS